MTYLLSPGFVNIHRQSLSKLISRESERMVGMGCLRILTDGFLIQASKDVLKEWKIIFMLVYSDSFQGIHTLFIHIETIKQK